MVGISFSDGVVIIDGVNTSFSNLYSASLNAGNNLVLKSGNVYIVDANLVIKNNGGLRDTSKTISYLGTYLDIQKGSTLQLGIKYGSISTGKGCVFTAPNLQNEFGFGGLDPDNSGNFLCYSSTVNAYCYWSFFRGDNLVDIINSTIDGYGRISGSNSNIYNVVLNRIHGKYGSLMPATKIANYGPISAMTIDPITVDETLPDLENLFTLDGNTFADSASIDIHYANTVCTYTNLVQVLDSVVNKPIRFYGGIITNGYNVSRMDVNKNDFHHLLKFNPYVQNTDGVRLPGLPVVIKNKKGEIEYQGVTDIDGSINTWLTRYRDLAGVQVGEYMTPHQVCITCDGEETAYVINLETNIEKFPLILHPQLTINGSNLGSIVKTIVDLSTEDIKDTINRTDTNVNQLLIAMSDKIKETKTIVERDKFSVTI